VLPGQLRGLLCGLLCGLATSNDIGPAEMLSRLDTPMALLAQDGAPYRRRLA
jgi:hypothetical protein